MESDVDIQTFLRKVGENNAYSYRIKTLYMDSLKTDRYNLSTLEWKGKKKASAVQMRMYEGNGKFHYGWQMCFGDLKKAQVLDSFPLKKTPFPDMNMQLSLQRDLNLFEMSEAEKLQILREATNKQYVITVFWTGWTGWFAKDAFRKLKRYLRKYHQKENVLVLKLNLTKKE